MHRLLPEQAQALDQNQTLLGGILGGRGWHRIGLRCSVYSVAQELGSVLSHCAAHIDRLPHRGSCVGGGHAKHAPATPALLICICCVTSPVALLDRRQPHICHGQVMAPNCCFRCANQSLPLTANTMLSQKLCLVYTRLTSRRCHEPSRDSGCHWKQDTGWQAIVAVPALPGVRL